MANTESLISEVAVLARWPALSKSTLRAARKAGRISWVKGKRSSAWYRASAVEKFIEKRLEQPCHDQDQSPYLSSVANGSLTTQGPKNFIGSGLPSDLEELVARASAQRILKKQS
jgi:hypothetical protein